MASIWALISAPACGFTIAMLEDEGASPTAAAAPAACSPEPPRMGWAGEGMFALARLPGFWRSGFPTMADLESAYGWTVCSVLNSVRITEASSGSRSEEHTSELQSR